MSFVVKSQENVSGISTIPLGGGLFLELLQGMDEVKQQIRVELSTKQQDEINHGFNFQQKNAYQELDKYMVKRVEKFGNNVFIQMDTTGEEEKLIHCFSNGEYTQTIAFIHWRIIGRLVWLVEDRNGTLLAMFSKGCIKIKSYFNYTSMDLGYVLNCSNEEILLLDNLGQPLKISTFDSETKIVKDVSLIEEEGKYYQTILLENGYYMVRNPRKKIVESYECNEDFVGNGMAFDSCPFFQPIQYGGVLYHSYYTRYRGEEMYLLFIKEKCIPYKIVESDEVISVRFFDQGFWFQKDLKEPLVFPKTRIRNSF